MSDGPKRFPLAAQVLGLAVGAIALALAGQAPLYLGIQLYNEQILAVIVGLALGVCFLTQPLRLGGRLGAALDKIFAVLGTGAGFYLAVRFGEIGDNLYANRTEAALIGMVLVPLILEGLRRTTGPTLPLLTLAFMAYATVADLAPGRLQGREMAPPDLLAFVTADSLAMFGIPLTIAGTIVVVFVIFGQFLQQTGGAAWFTDLATTAVGRYRGGPAKIAVVASALFGSISGSAVANVASTGIITIPMMKKAGLSPRQAGAYEAVASTGGQIAPPIMGAAAFLMAQLLDITYAEVIVAAAVPAALFYFAVLLSADMQAARAGAPPLSDAEVPKITAVLRRGWYFPIPFVVLVYLLFSWNLGPAEAALWAGGALIASSLVFGGAGNRIGPTGFLIALSRGGIAAVDIILVGAAAGIIIGILENTGLSFGLTYILVGLGEGDMWVLLLATAVICILLGMGMPTTGIYILVATLAGPPLIHLGIAPLAAHMFVLYFGLMSMISPPVAIAAFTAASIAGAGPMATALSAMRIGWIAFVMPFLFVADPALMLQGTLGAIALSVVTVIAGVWAAGAGIMGFFVVPLGPGLRALALAAGCALMATHFHIPAGNWLLAGGIAGLAALALLARRAAPARSRVRS